MKRILITVTFLAVVFNIFAVQPLSSHDVAKYINNPQFQDPRELIPKTDRAWLKDLATTFNWSEGWTPSSTVQCLYDQFNRLSRIENRYYSDGTWTLLSATDYYYNAAGSISEIRVWSTSGEEWLETIKLAYIYNTSHQLSEVRCYQRSAGEWHYTGLTTYQYIGDLLHQVVSYTIQNNVSHDYLYMTYTYNALQQVIELFERNIEGDWEFVYDYRSLYTYNPDGSLQLIVNQSFDDGNSGWVNSGRSLYNYNTQAQLTNLTCEYYSQSDQSWVSLYQYLYSYNANGCLVEELYQLYQNNTWVNSTKTTNQYHFVANNDDILPVTALQLSCYPIPFHSSLTIDTKNTAGKITVYNIKGQAVRHLEAVKDTNLSWDGKDNADKSLPSGIYYIRLVSGAQNITKRVVLLR